jgi:predicted N-acyltransferase
MPAGRPSGRLTLFERAEELPPGWDSAARGGGLSLSSRFLRVVHQNAVEASARRYLLYQTQGGGAVIAVAELLRPPAARNPAISVLLGRLNSHLPSARDWLLPMLILRPELSSDAPYCTADSTVADRGASLRSLLAELEAHAEQQGWSLAVDAVPASDRDMTDALAERGYFHTVARPAASLRLEWDSWQTYLQRAARNNRNAATNIRHEVNRARRDGITIVEWNPAAVPETELHRLQAEHEQRLNDRAWAFRPGFLTALSQSLGEDVKVLLAMCASQLQGVVVFAKSGKRGYLTYPGLLAKAERINFAYFNLVYYHPIRLAIELGLESIGYGNGALEAKIRRGCVAQARALFFRPREKILRTALRAPFALHRRGLQRKYAVILQAAPFSNLSRSSHAHPADECAS